jgi:hypothetical protein
MMEAKKELSFELHEDMVGLVAQEFSPEDIANSLADTIKGKSREEIPENGERLFTGYGVKWGKRVVELGESYMDRTYEVLKESIEQTGSPTFPLVPQRFIEIAYLSTQELSTLPVIENNFARFIFRIENCKIYQGITEGCGEEVAQLLTCRHGCLNLCRTIIEELNIDEVVEEMSATTPEKGYCEFVLRKTNV